MSQIGRPVSVSPTFVEDCEVISIKDLPRPYKCIVEITRNCPTCGSVTFESTVWVERTRQGPRYRCFYCRALVMKLYKSSRSDDWRCRRCHDLRYEGQYKKGKNDPFEELIKRYQPSLES